MTQPVVKNAQNEDISSVIHESEQVTSLCSPQIFHPKHEETTYFD